MVVVSQHTCPVLVGRTSELTRLESLLDESAHGQARLAVITGEAGVGKSRVMRELLTRAKARHTAQTLMGSCRELDRDFPFAPIADALRQKLAEDEVDARDVFGADLDGFLWLLPELGRPSAAAPLPLAPEQEKRRCFEAIAALLKRLAARRPLLFVLEDLHWADATTLELLEVLPRRLHSTRTLILLTVRSDEQERVLDYCLAKLRREHVIDLEVSLEPLGREDVGCMLEAMLGTTSSATMIAAVHTRTEGNPFFIEELVAGAPASDPVAWLGSEPAVPGTVREAVLRRLDGLGREAQAICNLAAAMGRRSDLDLLTAASGMPREQVIAALEVLVERNILEEQRHETGGDAFVFRHALTRDAIYGHLLLARRRDLHLQVATVLERLNQGAAGGQRGAAGDGDLGYHFHAAQHWDHALTYASRAGDAARQLHATSEALIHYQRALDAARALGSPRTAELERRCGQCLSLLGGFDAARQHLEAALQAARRDRDSALEQGALFDLARLYASRDYRQGQRYAEEALALARQMQDRRLEALALNRLGNMHTNLLRMGEARALHEDALERFRELKDPWGIADCLDLIGMARFLGGERAEARASFAQAAAAFAELDDTERVASSLTSSALFLSVFDGPCSADAGPSACRSDAVEGLRLSRALGWRAGESYALVAAASLDLAEGNYGDALRNADAALAIAREIDHQQWQVIALLALGLIHADLLDHRQALGRFESALQLAQAVGSAQWIERLEAWVACCRGRLGDRASAAAALTTLLPRTSHPGTIGQRRALCALAEIRLAEDNAEAALDLLDSLLEGASGPRPAALLFLRAKALLALGRHEEADGALLEARRLADEFGPRSLLWQIAAARADLWRESNAEISAEEARIARAEVSALARSIPEGELHAAFMQAAEVRPWVRPTGRQRTAPAPGAPGGLTPREREVIVGVAQGMSNREVASHLSIAEKTVEMHVSSCLGKLGFVSRAQLAAWAVTEGLAPAPRGPVA
jgi:DNA-binding CsgD family transcriptional regulator/tetratricopeptide (TPR) repeat protein